MAMQHSNRTMKDDLSSIWDIMKSIAFFLAIYLFFIGWFYLYFYFYPFGIFFTNVKFEITTVYNYGFLALARGNLEYFFLGFTIVLFIVYYLRKKLMYSYAIIFSLIIIFFFVSFILTKNNANAVTENILTKKISLNPIYFDFKEDFLKSMLKDSLENRLLNKKDSSLLKRSRTNGSVKLIDYNNRLMLSLFFENEEKYYVLYNPNPDGKIESNVEIFTVDKQSLNYATSTVTPRK